MTVYTLEHLQTRVGQEAGISPWFTVAQERINAFAEVTEDRQWIHVNRERAAQESPYHVPIAHGFLTLSLLSHLHGQAVQVEGPFGRVINYGLNRVRFPAPVRASDAVRAHSVLRGLEQLSDAWQLTWEITLEVQGQTKPALVAEWIVRLYRQ